MTGYTEVYLTLNYDDLLEKKNAGLISQADIDKELSRKPVVRFTGEGTTDKPLEPMLGSQMRWFVRVLICYVRTTGATYFLFGEKPYAIFETENELVIKEYERNEHIEALRKMLREEMSFPPNAILFKEKKDV